MPKQHLPLLGQPIALYSFYTFSKMPEVKEIVVVCDPSYQDIFEDAKENIQVDLKFALPGKERQDSVYSGLVFAGSIKNRYYNQTHYDELRSEFIFSFVGA